MPRLLLLLLVLTACGGRPPDVVLVTIDTLRADHLGLYGHPRPTSPVIDALGAESVVFEHAITTCPETAPSLASILTGLYRARHHVAHNKTQLPARVTTLAEILKAHGYRTAARVANPVLEAPFGFDQGFDDFAAPSGLDRFSPAMFEGSPLLPEVEHLLDAPGAGPLFLWVHFMDPHGPYAPPAADAALFRADDYRWGDEPDLPLSRAKFGVHLIPSYQEFGGERAPAAYRARYDGEIRHTDGLVSAVVDMLRTRGRWASTIFVLTADHGESLGEHDYYFQHGAHTYDDCLHVPLLVHAPRLPAGKRVAATVSTVDLAPTVLDLAGIPADAAMEGRTLRPLLDGGTEDRTAFSQTPSGNAFVALRRGPLAYVLNSSHTGARMGEELYDVAADPGELRDLATEEPARARELHGEVLRWLGTQRDESAAAEPSRPVDPAVERQLRALGYPN